MVIQTTQTFKCGYSGQTDNLITTKGTAKKSHYKENSELREH